MSPIVAPTLAEAVSRFREHVNRLLAVTLTQARLVAVQAGTPARQLFHLGFRQRGAPFEADLRTRFGPMSFYLGQMLEGSAAADGQVRLVTTAYRYTLTAEGAFEPLLRWEYVKRWPDGAARWCRHHIQGPAEIHFPRESVSLNELHLPTGYVALEDVLRFCLADLAAPPLSDGWHAALEDSYRMFRESLAR